MAPATGALHLDSSEIAVNKPNLDLYPKRHQGSRLGLG